MWGSFALDSWGWALRGVACVTTGPHQEIRDLSNRKVWPRGGVFLFYFTPCFSITRAAAIQHKHNPAIVQRHQNSNIWFMWHEMKQRRLEVASSEWCQTHPQHHTCSFFNHDQVLPILGNLNSKGWSVSNGTMAAPSVSLTSDRVTDGTSWSCCLNKRPNLNTLESFINSASPPFTVCLVK